MNVPAAGGRCLACGAECDPRTPTCWLCYSKLGELGENPYTSGLGTSAPGSPVQDQAISKSSDPEVGQPYSTVDYCFLFLLLGCVVLTLLIAVGIAADNPSGLAGFAILVSPAYAITAIRALGTAASGRKPRPAQMFSTLLLSFVGTIAVMVLLAAASVILMVAVCFGAVFPQG